LLHVIVPVKTTKRKIRYAVVGLGHIAQIAVLPAFAHASENSELTALVSSDATKLRALGRRYGVSSLYTYDQYDELLGSGTIDAVYIALPNHQHMDFGVRAAKHGVHVLCEKPLALTERECFAMIRAAQQNGVKLMTAYRLHFEQANLEAIETLREGKIGEPRLFNSVFCMDVREGDIRLRRETGGGTLYDIGIYCINAARYLFRDEPIEVLAMSASGDQTRFSEVEEMAGGILRFPGDRLATFICSFGTADVARYQVVGTKGDLALDPAYEYAMELKRHLKIGARKAEKTYAKRDQFAPELLYFSECVQKNRQPEPSGWEGLADVRIISALYRSAKSGRAVSIQPVERMTRPTVRQEIRRPAVKKPKLVKTTSPSK
jgi:predicted dehydrogenase